MSVIVAVGHRDSFSYCFSVFSHFSWINKYYVHHENSTGCYSILKDIFKKLYFVYSQSLQIKYFPDLWNALWEGTWGRFLKTDRESSSGNKANCLSFLLFLFFFLSFSLSRFSFCLLSFLGGWGGGTNGAKSMIYSCESCRIYFFNYFFYQHFLLPKLPVQNENI